MREMIISELSQAIHDLARGFAHYLPRLIVMLILAFLGWAIAYVVKVVLRNILKLIKFDKLSENAGASQLLNKADLPSATELLSQIRFLGDLAGIHPAERERARDPGLARADRNILPLLAATFRSNVHPVFWTTGGQLFFARYPAGRSQCEHPVATSSKSCRSQHHYRVCTVDRVRGIGPCRRDDVGCFWNRLRSVDVWLGDCVWNRGRNLAQRFLEQKFVRERKEENEDELSPL